MRIEFQFEGYLPSAERDWPTPPSIGDTVDLANAPDDAGRWSVVDVTWRDRVRKNADGGVFIADNLAVTVTLGHPHPRARGEERMSDANPMTNQGGGASKRTAATTALQAMGPYSTEPCDCDAAGCRAWYVMSSEFVICVAQTEEVAMRIMAAMYWAYREGGTTEAANAMHNAADALEEVARDIRSATWSFEKKAEAKAAECRRCADCEGQDHHLLEEGTCKHCDARAEVCEAAGCEYGNCIRCGGTGWVFSKEKTS